MAALSAPLFVTEVTDDEQASMSEKIYKNVPVHYHYLLGTNHL
jgi:hypothetical protein